MTPIAQQALARARARFKSDSASQFADPQLRETPAGEGPTIAGIPVRTERGMPDGVMFLVAKPNPGRGRVVKLVQSTRQVTAELVDNYMFQQGRKYAVELAASLHAMDRVTICDNLIRSAAGKPEGYALGIQSVIDLIEAAQ